MTASSFSLSIPAGLEVNQFLSFAPLAAIVSNFTPFYMYFPDGLSFVPPWTNGAIVGLSHATQARASWLSSPFGPQTLYTTPNLAFTATITYTDNPNAIAAGGTTIVPPVIPAASSLIQSIATIQTGSATVTVTIAPATAGNLLVGAWARANGNVGVVSAYPAGWTQLTTAASGQNQVWLGYKIATGGETSLAVTFSGVDNASSESGVVSEYSNFPVGIFQNVSGGGNSQTVTPVTSPFQLIAFAAWTATNGVLPGTVSSPNVIIRKSVISALNGTNSTAIAIGDLSYNTLVAATGTVNWVGVPTGNWTAVIAGE